MPPNRFYQTGLLIGAAPKEWTLDQYKTKARAIAAGIAQPFAIVAIARDGTQTTGLPATEKAKASDAYGQLASNPGETVYLAYFDRTVPAGEDALIDEAFFQPTDIYHETIKTERVSSPAIPTPIKALGLASVLGLIALIAKH